jgi:hypothetical protein
MTPYDLVDGNVSEGPVASVFRVKCRPSLGKNRTDIGKWKSEVSSALSK